MMMTAHMQDEWFKKATPEEREAREKRLEAAIKAGEAYREALKALAEANEPNPLTVGFHPLNAARRLAQRIDRFLGRNDIVSVFPGRIARALEPRIRRIEKKLAGEPITYLKLVELQLQELRRTMGIVVTGFDIMSMLGR